MGKTIFETDRIPFKIRCRKDIRAKIFTFLFFASIPIFSFENNAISILFSILFILFFLFVILYETYYESREFVYKIEFENEKINIFGCNYDKDWVESFEIKKVNIKIKKHIAKFGRIIGYSIEFKNGKKKITLNKLHNWNNFTLYQIFNEFKKLKDEKIIIDEKSLIDGIKKKAEEEGEWKN